MYSLAFITTVHTELRFRVFKINNKKNIYYYHNYFIKILSNFTFLFLFIFLLIQTNLAY